MNKNCPAQAAADKLTKYNGKDYEEIPYANGGFSAEETFALRLKRELSQTSRHESRNRLTKHGPLAHESTVLHVLKTWMVSYCWSGQVQDYSCWISDTLATDLGIPLETRLPACVILQAVFLGEHAPPLILMVYDSGKCEDELLEQLRYHTAEMARLLTGSMLNFCCVDFAFLPCVLALSDLHTKDALSKEIETQQKFQQRYFHGPRVLSEVAYEELSEAVTSVSCSSHVPFLLDTTESKEGCLLLLDEKWRDLLFLIIEKVQQNGEVCQLTYTPETEFKVKVVVLEVARRLALRQNVKIVSWDSDVRQCTKRMIKQVRDEDEVDIADKVEVTNTNASRMCISISCPQVARKTAFAQQHSRNATMAKQQLPKDSSSDKSKLPTSDTYAAVVKRDIWSAPSSTESRRRLCATQREDECRGNTYYGRTPEAALSEALEVTKRTAKSISKHTDEWTRRQASSNYHKQGKGYGKRLLMHVPPSVNMSRQKSDLPSWKTTFDEDPGSPMTSGTFTRVSDQKKSKHRVTSPLFKPSLQDTEGTVVRQTERVKSLQTLAGTNVYSKTNSQLPLESDSNPGLTQYRKDQTGRDPIYIHDRDLQQVLASQFPCRLSVLSPRMVE